MSEKPFEVRWALENARKAVDTLENHFEHLTKVANTTTGKIMPVKRCEKTATLSAPISSYEKSGYYPYSITLSAEKVCEKALAEVEAAIAEDRATHEANKPALENNIALSKNVSLMMTNMGIPETYSVFEWNKRGTKRVEDRRSAGWKLDLARVCVCSDYIEECERRYSEKIKAIAEYKRKREAAEAAKKAEEEKIENAKKEAKELAMYLVKYNLDATDSWGSVLAVILEKNKYLRLAHYLRKNRGDWSDGPDYAETGMDSFTVETETDKKIAAEISALVSDWDGDGRVFRDCEYNYDIIFGMVNDAELMKEYEFVNDKNPNW